MVEASNEEKQEKLSSEPLDPWRRHDCGDIARYASHFITIQ